MNLGAHFSIAGGLENALYEAKNLNCGSVQIFTKNARAWKEPQLSDDMIQTFRQARKTTGISKAFSHCTYLINIASNDQKKLEKSKASLLAEMKRSQLLGIDGVVLHPGAHLGLGIEKGLETALTSLDLVLANDKGNFPKLIIETTAGTGTCLGSRFEEISTLIDGIHPSHSLGVCLDTSHIFAAGYDIRTREVLDHTLDCFESSIGLSRLCLIHANDSKTGLGSRKDRHEHIGMGHIGISGFRAIMNHPALAGIPKILETPKESNGRAMDAVNLDLLKSLIQK